MDVILVLSPEQRKQLTEKLADHLQSVELPDAELLMNETRYFPEIPDALINPILNDTQRNLWQRTDKFSHFVRDLGFGNVVPGIADFQPVD